MIAKVGTVPVPVPVSVTLNGFCAASLLAMCSTAVRAPPLWARTARSAVVVPPGATGDTGLVVTREQRRIGSIDRRGEPGQIARARVLQRERDADRRSDRRGAEVTAAVLRHGRARRLFDDERGQPATAPLPVRAMLKGFWVASLLAMCSAAVSGPLAAGANCTVKVVVPLAADRRAGRRGHGVHRRIRPIDRDPEPGQIQRRRCCGS